MKTMGAMEVMPSEDSNTSRISDRPPKNNIHIQLKLEILASFMVENTDPLEQLKLEGANKLKL